MSRPKIFLPLLIFLISLSGLVQAQQATEDENQPDESVLKFVGLLFLEDPQLSGNLNYIHDNWQAGFAPMALEIMRLSRNRRVIDSLFVTLRARTGQQIGNDMDKWYQWLWNRPEERYAHFAQFKSMLYRLIDHRFEQYFDDDRVTGIRLDEVIWGGVKQDGIPPLRQPAMIAAETADYLDDSNVVFGVEINGDARAYPKRILAWHEMFVDVIGGTEFAGVYCTLCGALILYQTHHDGVRHEVGTSGFLYRSNKLMYDKATQSLWNTTWGQPVIGPLADRGIALERSYVVTTTWGEWRRRHPETTVLSLETGHRRDYGEGVAYNAYFATDELMFEVPQKDTRLKNKDEILALVFPSQSADTLAIAADYLAENPVYHDSLGGLEFVVLTDGSGANRVYETGGNRFEQYDGDFIATDDVGQQWMQTERALTSASGEALKRLPAHRAFWFGWYAANRDTRLVF